MELIMDKMVTKSPKAILALLEAIEELTGAEAVEKQGEDEMHDAAKAEEGVLLPMASKSMDVPARQDEETDKSMSLADKFAEMFRSKPVEPKKGKEAFSMTKIAMAMPSKKK